MTYLGLIYLLAIDSFIDTDFLIWVAATPLALFAVFYLFYQQRQSRLLNEELKQLSKVRHHSIEYELVLKAMKLCIWRVDVKSHVVTYDSDYRDSIENIAPPNGATVEDIIAQLAPEYQEKVGHGMQQLLEGSIDDFHIQYQVCIPHSDRSYWGEGYATVERRGDDGKPVTIVGTTMRIDKQKQIEQALIEARNHAEESDRLKSDFLANISHEVRTPLNAIIGFSDVMSMAESDEERQELMKLIKNNNEHLLRLFDDMVNMSKLDAGVDAAKKTRFDLNDLLAEVVEKYESVSKETGVKLILETMPVDPRPFTDRDRLREIINQYVNNAMKFTSEGSVTVGYDRLNNQLRVWVKDTGKGIAEEHCGDHLFDRFVKIDEFVPGAGLGLCICRTLAQSLGGTVGVQSKLGEGSLFWVELSVN